MCKNPSGKFPSLTAFFAKDEHKISRQIFDFRDWTGEQLDNSVATEATSGFIHYKPLPRHIEGVPQQNYVTIQHVCTKVAHLFLIVGPSSGNLFTSSPRYGSTWWARKEISSISLCIYNQVVLQQLPVQFCNLQLTLIRQNLRMDLFARQTSHRQWRTGVRPSFRPDLGWSQRIFKKRKHFE